MNTHIDSIIAENKRRNAALDKGTYDPLIGNPDDPQRTARFVLWQGATCHLPREMVADPKFEILSSATDYRRMRLHYDFEFWAASCVNIRDKKTGKTVPFKLNAPQRRVAATLEADRRAGRPLRLIMLKARQWGGSTLIQMYFAWIQICHRRNWNSLICAHVKDTANAIRGMYDNMLKNYPEDLWLEDDTPRFIPWQKSQNTREIAGRSGKVTVSSSYGQDAARGLDFSMAHLSEVAFWMATDRKSPEDFIRNVCGGIPMEPLTMIAMESTANGVGNFFHTQWQTAEAGKSAYRAVFVPWHEIEIYRKECPDPQKFIESWTPYERDLWQQGLTLEMIQWYHDKRAEFPTDGSMHAEYPTNPVEAFENTGRNVFCNDDIDRLRDGCLDAVNPQRRKIPVSQRPLLDSPAGDGQLMVWKMPPEDPDKWRRDRYVVAVDVGGRWTHADYSVITVFDRLPDSGDDRIEVVAQWRGHCDHDLLARYAETVARIYCNALLVIESNSLESAQEGASQYILEELNSRYRNLYVRIPRDKSGDTHPQPRVGFHTNRTTKAAVITGLIAAVRRGDYIEHDYRACNEMATYELQRNGSYAARRGYHDDILMTRAIGLYVISTLRPLHRY